MFTSIGLTLSGLIFTVLIAAFYFTKKRYRDIENNIYRFLLIITIVILLLELVCVYTMSIRDQIPILNELLCRMFILATMTWFLTIIAYMRSVTTKKHYLTTLNFLQDNFMITVILISSILFFGSCFLDISYTSSIPGLESQFYVIGGKAVYALYGIFVFVGFYMFKVLFTDLNKENYMKRVPVFVFLISYFVMMIVQQAYADLNELAFLFAFCVVSMYFTLENQDMRLVSEFEEAKKEAEEADEAKTEFLSKMSHEIRTPMNAIMGFSDFLINKDDLTEEEIKRDVKNIYNAGKGLLETINNILIFSRIGSGKEKVEVSEYSISDIVLELDSFVRSKIDSNKVKFIIKVDKNIPAIYIGDKLKVYRILSNIINNSIKYTTNGEILFSVTCDILDNGIGKLNFTIKDTGYGIKKEELDDLFKHFSNVEMKDTNVSGTGLGLAVVKQLLDMLGGQISFDSEYGIGTTFNVTLEQKIFDDTKVGNIFESTKNKESSLKKEL